MRRLLNAGATNAKPRFVPNENPTATRLTGTNLAGSNDPRIDRALVMLCSLRP